MHVFSPLEVMLTEEEFLQPGRATYMTEHVMGNDGTIYRHWAVSAGRKCLIKTGTTGFKANAAPTMLKETLEPLAYGHRIPMQMLVDIIAFFKQVMKDPTISGSTATHAHGNYEAMAHIVWNETTQSYRVAIPTQVVSKAAVTYTNDHIDHDCEHIILDIHSHNTMGAFFSGTDEADDKGGTRISGVAGNLDRANPNLIWRFNLHNKKTDMKLEEIFEVNEVANPVPTEWMDKVSVRTYTPYTPYTPKGNYGAGTYSGSAGNYGAGTRSDVAGALDSRVGDKRLGKFGSSAAEKAANKWGAGGYPQTLAEIQEELDALGVDGTPFLGDAYESLVRDYDDYGQYSPPASGRNNFSNGGRGTARTGRSSASYINGLVDEVKSLSSEDIVNIVVELTSDMDVVELSTEGIYVVAEEVGAKEAIGDIISAFIHPSDEAEIHALISTTFQEINDIDEENVKRWEENNGVIGTEVAVVTENSNEPIKH